MDTTERSNPDQKPTHAKDHCNFTPLPVFPIERSIKIKSYSIRRKQVPTCAAFSLTDYKVQGQTFPEAILDLKNNTGTRGRDSHRKFCSRYVQLSRVTSFAGLHLLERLDMSDISGGPHELQLAEMSRSETLEKQTLATWEAEGLYI